VDLMGIISPGAPGLYEPRQREILRENIEYVMDSTIWHNVKSPRAQKIEEEHIKRTGGKNLGAEAGYGYEAILVMADVLERSKSADPDAIVDAIKKTNFTGGIMMSTGPIRFNEFGDNPNAATAMIQILKNKPIVVWPKDAAQAQVVFPRPKV